MKKDFITATPDSGTGGGTVTTAAKVNTAFQDKQTTLNVSGGGITRSVRATESGVPFLFDLGISINKNQSTFTIQNGCPVINSSIEISKGSVSLFLMKFNPILLIKSSIKSSPYLTINSGEKINLNQISENNDYTLYQPSQESGIGEINPSHLVIDVYNGSTKILQYNFDISYV